MCHGPDAVAIDSSVSQRWLFLGSPYHLENPDEQHGLLLWSPSYACPGLLAPLGECTSQHLAALDLCLSNKTHHILPGLVPGDLCQLPALSLLKRPGSTKHAT